MAVNETAVIRQLKKQYKNGYSITQRGERIIINATIWGMILPMEELPRRILGLIVEHAGTIPFNSSMKVQKGVPNQMILDEYVHEHLGFMQQSLEQEAVSTPILYKGKWQLCQLPTQNMIGVPAELLDLVDNAKTPMASDSAQMVRFDSSDDEVWYT